MTIGDRIPLKQNAPEILGTLLEQIHEAKILAAMAAQQVIQAEHDFWEEFHALFPGGRHLRWMLDPETGECVATKEQD